MKILGIVLVIVCIFIFGYLSIVNSPKSTELSTNAKKNALQKLLNRDAVLTVTPTSSDWKDFISDEISFQYPSWGKRIDTPSPLKSQKLLFSISIKKPIALLTVLVEDHSDLQSVAEYPGVSSRRLSKDCVESTGMVSSHSAVFFTKHGDIIEKSAFVYTGVRVYSLVVTAPDEQDATLLYNRLVTSATF